MTPITTKKTTGMYRAPKGRENEIGGLPFYREAGVIYSVWELEDWERRAIAGGQNIILGIIGEPIPPVSLGITNEFYAGEEDE